MILTKSRILKALHDGEIVIKPEPKDFMIGVNSIDIRIGPSLLYLESHAIDYLDSVNGLARTRDGRAVDWRELKMDETEGTILRPGTLYLASTYEWIGSDRFHMQLHGRSSAARLGLSIHETAGYGDLGFEGRWTLEIFVKLPIRIWPYQKIGQVSFSEVLADPNQAHRDILYRERDRGQDLRYSGMLLPVPSKGLGKPIPPDLGQERG